MASLSSPGWPSPVLETVVELPEVMKGSEYGESVPLHGRQALLSAENSEPLADRADVEETSKYGCNIGTMGEQGMPASLVVELGPEVMRSEIHVALTHLMQRLNHSIWPAWLASRSP